jgi:hypothetical protein
MIMKHSMNYQILGVTFGAWAVCGFVMKYGRFEWSWLDMGCIVGGAVGILLMAFLDPVPGIIVSCSVAFVGSYPTFTHAWEKPSGEDRSSWVIFWTSCVLQLVAIPAFTWQDAAQPITFFAIESVMMCILFIRPPFMKVAIS